MIEHWIESDHPVYLICILSPEDKYLEMNVKTCLDNNIEYIMYKNLPIGEKVNAGIDYILKRYDFDYLFKIDSDDLISPEIWQTYFPLMVRKELYFGITNVIFFNGFTGDMMETNYPIVCGAAKMIHRDILKKCNPVYPSLQNSGLDGGCQERIKKVLNIEPLKVDVKHMALDIKTNTNINSWMSMKITSYSNIIETETIWSNIKDRFKNIINNKWLT